METALGGFALVPWLGSSRAGVVLGTAAGAVGLVLLAVARPRVRDWRVAGEVVAVLLLAVLVLRLDDPYREIMHQRILSRFPNGAIIYRHTEDATAAVTAFTADRVHHEAKNLWVNGHGMTVLTTLTKLMAHLPIWMVDEPRDMAVICFGMGTTFRSAVLHERINVAAVELVPTVVECFGYYHADADAVLARPNARVTVDDGRNFLAMRPDLYDVITIDPAPPLHSAGTVNLYTREFFELCRSRTRAGGVVCLWIPPAEYSEVEMICRTFTEVFPHLTVWSPTHHFQGLYLIGSMHPIDGIARRIHGGYENPRILEDLLEWDEDASEPEKVLGWYVCDGEELRTIFAHTPIITDDQPWTEFPLWRFRRLAGQPILNGDLLYRLADRNNRQRRTTPP